MQAMDKVKELAKNLKGKLEADNYALLKKALMNGVIAASLSLKGYVKGRSDYEKSLSKWVIKCHERNMPLYFENKKDSTDVLCFEPTRKDEE